MKQKQNKSVLTSKRFNKKLSKLKESESLKGYKPKFQHVLNKPWTDDDINRLADEMYKWFMLKNNFWLKDFAIKKQVSPQRFSEFAKRSSYFAEIHEICKQIQESKLFTLGIQTRSSMPIFALKNVSGWRDKQDHNVQILDKDSARKAVEEIFE